MKMPFALVPLIYRVACFVLLLSILLGGMIIDASTAQARGVKPSSSASIAGCPLFPADNIWNYDISKLPVHPNSANFIASISKTDQLRSYFGATVPGYTPPGIPYIVVPGTQRNVPVHFTAYGGGSDPGPYPIPSNAPIEGGPKSNNDRHVIVVNSNTCKLYETWLSYPHSDGSWDAGSGAVWSLNSNNLRPNSWTSADAAGLPILPGLVRYDEVAAGAITHALRVVVNRTQSSFLWPARHFASSDSNPNLPPMGLRLRLKASFDISSFSPQNRVILTALKHYGLFVADNGPLNWVVSGVPDKRWNNKDLALLGRIHGSDFEAVDESALQVAPNSGQVKSSGQTPKPTYGRTSNGTGTSTKLYSQFYSSESMDMVNRRAYLIPGAF